MSIPTDATHGIDFVIVWDLESLSQKHNVNTNICNAWYQPYATSPPFLCNLHLGRFVKCFNHISWLKHLTNCPKWRLHKKGGLVAYAWQDAYIAHRPGVGNSSPRFVQSPHLRICQMFLTTKRGSNV